MKYSQEFIDYANETNVEDTLYGVEPKKMVELYNSDPENSENPIFYGVDDFISCFGNEEQETIFDAIRTKDVSIDDEYLTYNGRGMLVGFSNIDDENSPIYVPELASYLIEQENEDLLQEYGVCEIDFDDEDEVMYYAVRKHLADLRLNDLDSYKEMVASALNTQFYDLTPNNFNEVFKGVQPSDIAVMVNKLSRLGIDDIHSRSAVQNKVIYWADGTLNVCSDTLSGIDKYEVAQNIIKNDDLMQQLKETGFDFKNIVEKPKNQMGLGR